MSRERNLKYLNDHRIVYRQHPINDIPDQENEVYMFYLNVLEIMSKKLRNRINQSGIIFHTLGTVTTAPNIKE